MTFTYPLINGAHRVVFMVAGAAKADVLHSVLEGPRDLRTFPSQGVMPGQGSLLWLVDRAAWGSGS
jgi:6-phosphogluconolactonase